MNYKKLSPSRAVEILLILVVLPSFAHATNCPYGNTNPLCPNSQAAEQAQERAAQQAQERAAEQAQERAAQQAQERAAQQAQERAAQQAQERAAEQARERAAQQAQERAAEQARERAAQQAQERAAEQARERAAQQAQERAAEQARERAAQQAQERAAEQARERAAQQAQERAAQQAQERAAQQAQERAAEQGRERAAQQVQERAAEQGRERAAQQVQERAAEQARERAAQQAQGRATEQGRERASPQAQDAPAQAQSLGGAFQPRDKAVAQPRGAVPPAAAAPLRTTPINASTVLYSTSGRPGYRAEKVLSDRSRVVVTQQPVPHSGKVVIQAYRQTSSADGKVTTRVYSDGTRTVQAPTFSSRGVTGGTQLVHYPNGLRAAYTSRGQAIYSETFVHRVGVIDNHLIQRTVYSTTVGGVIRPLAHPIYHYYTVVPVAGYATYVYEPVVYAPGFFVPLFSPFGTAVIVGPACLLCPIATVAFDQAVAQYTDPVDLLGDEQIADAAAADGSAVPEDQVQPSDDPQIDSSQLVDAGGDTAPAPAPVDEPAPPPPPELLAEDTAPTTAGAPEVLASLKSEAHEVTGDITAHFRTAVATGADAPAGMNTSDAVEPESTLPLTISEDARQQIHKQVRLSVAQHANRHEQSLASILSSGYSHIYLFQIDEPLQVTDLGSGAGCTLGEGELIRIADAQDSQAVQVRVIASRAGHCSVGDTVQVTAGALQDMLNTFNLRIECNMRKIRRAMTTLST